jgi:hypothetical protein
MTRHRTATGREVATLIDPARPHAAPLHAPDRGANG